MKKTKPKITEVIKKNMYVKCPHCGQHNRVLIGTMGFVCYRCHRSVSMGMEYKVDKYY